MIFLEGNSAKVEWVTNILRELKECVGGCPEWVGKNCSKKTYGFIECPKHTFLCELRCSELCQYAYRCQDILAFLI